MPGNVQVPGSDVRERLEGVSRVQDIVDLVKEHREGPRKAVLAPEQGNEDDEARVSVRFGHFPIPAIEREPSVEK